MNAPDRFLNGRVRAVQPGDGFRSGLDAVMLAAAVPARRGDAVLELGAGAGVASLCLAARVPGCAILGLEIDASLVDIANGNATANDLPARFALADVLAPASEHRREFAHVFSNPPFHDGHGVPSPDTARGNALQDGGQFAAWLAAGMRRTASGGTFTLILRTDRLGEALALLPARGVTLFPLWPRAGSASKRTLIQIRKNAASPLLLLAGLVLHEADGRFTPDADAILRDGLASALGRV